ANLERVAVKRVDAEHDVALVLALLDDGVDRLRLATGIEAEIAGLNDARAVANDERVDADEQSPALEVAGRHLLAVFLERLEDPGALEFLQLLRGGQLAGRRFLGLLRPLPGKRRQQQTHERGSA